MGKQAGKAADTAAKHASADELFLRVRLFPSVRRPGEIYTAVLASSRSRVRPLGPANKKGRAAAFAFWNCEERPCRRN